MKIERKSKFVPLVCEDRATVIVLPRERWSDEVARSAILAVDGSLDPRVVESHVKLLLRRQRGELQFGHRGPTDELDLTEMERRWGLPVYTTEVAPGRFFRWSMDVFNPMNQECKIPLYDNSKEYLEFIVRLQGFRNFKLHLGGFATLEDVVGAHCAYNNCLSRCFMAAGGEFAFGTASEQLRWLCYSYHFGTRKWKEGLGFSDFFWQWAIYPPGGVQQMRIRKMRKLRQLSDESESLRHLLDKHGDPEVVRFDELANGSLLAWTLTCYSSLNHYYAKAAGLKDIFSVDLREIPE